VPVDNRDRFALFQAFVGCDQAGNTSPDDDYVTLMARHFGIPYLFSVVRLSKLIGSQMVAFSARSHNDFTTA
jgi:hypothetical protein